jgi:hypothetical protein
MRLAIWKTGHEIADTVADALAEGFNGEIKEAKRHTENDIISFDAHIGYGILRGAADIFKAAGNHQKSWFNVDRGYLEPGHYSGYYRISNQGTQARWHDGIPRKPYHGQLEPWRPLDIRKPILVCPPTPHARQFFAYTGMDFEVPYRDDNYVVRLKGDSSPLNLSDYRAVITFNSSIGWEALQLGIPCWSHPDHSIIGSHYKGADTHNFTDKLLNLPDTRRELFEAMQAHQFTLDEIRQGKAWDLIRHYTSSSAGIAGKLSPPMFAPIPSKNALSRRFQYDT